MFDTALPHPRTLTKWYANLNGRPEFTQEALNALKIIKESDKEKKLLVVLEEMKIKESSEWHPLSQRHFGHVDFGFDIGTDNSTNATDALVLLLVGINTVWKLFIEYFLIKGADAKLRARLVTTAIEFVHATGIEIKALTCAMAWHQNQHMYGRGVGLRYGSRESTN